MADADIAAVANQVLGETLKAPFQIDPAVTGKMSFRTSRPLSGDELLSAFEAALALSDVALVRRGDGFTVMPRAKAKAAAGLRQVSSGAASLPAGFQLLAVNLNYVAPSDVAKAVEATGPSGIVVRADDQRGSLLLAGASGELRTALQTIRLLDRSGTSGGHTRILQLRAAAPSAVAAELEPLLQSIGATGVTVVPINRLNQLVVTARSDAVLDETIQWIGQLDTASHEEAFTLWAYRPRNVSADSLAQSLNDLLSAQKSASSDQASGASPLSTPVSQGDGNSASSVPAIPRRRSDTGPQQSGLRISVNKDTNTLLVMAPETRWTPLRAIIEQIDAPPPQILIEATVLEVTLGREFRTGVDWSVLGAGGRLTITSSHDAAGAVSAQYPGLALTYMDNTVKAVVDTLSSKTNVEVISAPKLVTLDNQSASLQVGDQVPIVNQTAQSTAAAGAPIVASTEYKDTGIILKVRPRVNGPDSVVVDVSQEVSSVSQTTSSTINSPTIQQRRFQVVTDIHDGQTVAIGGLISSNRSTTNKGIPFLMDIPAAGRLFKGADNINAKTEIIVLLSAHILRTSEQSALALGELRKQVEGTGDHGSPPKP